MNLPPGEAHLYSEDPARVTGLAGLEALLTPEERRRMLVYRFPRDRQRFLVARGLARTALARYLDLAPAAVRLTSSPHGKPMLDPPAGLHFNLSHTNGLAVCLIARCEAGVDVEELRPVDGLLDIARSFFAPDEERDLLQLAGDARRDRFFAYWTLKEAYAKARGEGFAIDFRTLRFQLDEGGPPALSLEAGSGPESNHRPGAWQFLHGRMGKGHLASAALQTRRGPALSLLQQESVLGH